MPYLLPLLLFVFVVVLTVIYMQMKKNTYVLFSDEIPPRTITKENEFFTVIEQKSNAINRHNAKNMHIYMKKKNKKTKEIYYVIKKTKMLTNKGS